MTEYFFGKEPGQHSGSLDRDQIVPLLQILLSAWTERKGREERERRKYEPSGILFATSRNFLSVSFKAGKERDYGYANCAW